jgi:hypothetical protein
MMRKDAAYRGGYSLGRAMGSFRRYSFLVTVVEAFLRTDMGRRYFTWRVASGGLAGLIVIRFFLSLNGYKTSLYGYEFDRVHYFDGFIILYVILSFYHFIAQRTGRARREHIHTYDVGYPRLAAVTKVLGFQKYGLVAYRFIEPLFVLLLAFPVLLYSFLLGVLMFIAAVRLAIYNGVTYNNYYQRELDIRDGKQEAKDMQLTMKGVERASNYQKKVRNTNSEPIEYEARQDRPKTINTNNSSSVEESLQKIRERMKKKKP